MSIKEVVGLAILVLPFVALFALVVRFALVARLEGVKVAVSKSAFIAWLTAWLVVGIELVKGAA